MDGITLWNEVLDGLHARSIQKARKEKCRALREMPYRTLVSKMNAFKRLVTEKRQDERDASFSSEGEAIVIGSPEDLPAEEHLLCDDLIRDLMPWKKGPYVLFGTKIFSEWNSHIKWTYLCERLLPIEDSLICDLGCNNGYYMFKMLTYKPRYILGMDPSMRCLLQYRFLKTFVRSERLHYEPLGYEHLSYLEKTFDLVLCLGILYHHTDPIKVLRLVHGSLRRGGRVIVECQGIASDESYALCPRGKYAGASGIWFLPTKACLKNWCHRAGYKKIDLFHEHTLTPKEQSTSKHAPYKSLKEALDATHPHRTVEGYPSPERYYLHAFKG